MADNLVANAGSGGATLAFDDIGSVFYPRTKVSLGADGSATDALGGAGAVAAGVQRVTLASDDPAVTALAKLGGVVSSANSSTANLAGAAAFTGTSEEVKDYAAILVYVFSSHASGTDGLSLQQSNDATNWDVTDVFTIPAATGKTFSIQPAARYYRLVYTNGATLTTSLRIMSVFHYGPTKASSQRPSDATSNENDFEQVSAFGHGFNGTTWDRLRTVNTGMLQVAPTFAGTVSSTGVGASGAQTQRVVTATDSTIGTVTAVTTVATVTNITNQGHGADDAAFTVGTTRVMVAGFLADETATDSVDEGDMGAARITLDRKQIVTPYAHATAGGHTPYKNLDVDESEDEVKGTAGKLFWIHAMNLSAVKLYLKIYNNTAAGVTVGTTVPDLTFPIGTMADTNGVGFMVPFGEHGIAMGTGITVACTTGFADNNTGAPGANECIVNLGYL